MYVHTMPSCYKNMNNEMVIFILFVLTAPQVNSLPRTNEFGNSGNNFDSDGSFNIDFGPNFPFNSNEFTTNLHRRLQETVFNPLSVQLASINENVQNSLKPVEANLVKLNMARGTGGVTIATYNNKQVYIQNGQRFQCIGRLVYNPGRQPACDGSLQPVPVDMCTPGLSRSQINDHICLGDNTQFSVHNGIISCANGFHTTLANLKTKCGPQYDTDNYVHYAYYPNPNDAQRIPIPHSNKYVTCNNPPSQGFCVWNSN